MAVLSGHTDGSDVLLSHQMGDHLHLEVMTELSSSGICRLVVLSRPSMVIMVMFIQFQFLEIALGLPQDLMIAQSVCGISRQESAFTPQSSRRYCIMFTSLPQIHSISCQYLEGRSGNGTPIVSKPPLYMMPPPLLFPQIILSLLCVMERLLKFRNLILEKL
jgi:hypothetical protein